MKNKRNPIASTLSNPAFRQKKEKSAEEVVKQKDGWDRKSKYKKSADIEESLQIGDKVSYKDNEGMVKNPNAPIGMIGITVDGKYALVPEDQLTIIEESFTKLFELAGLNYFEVTSGIQIPISHEENIILDKISDKPLDKSTLDERDQEVARKMVTRGLLNRKNKDGKVVFTKNNTKLTRN